MSKEIEHSHETNLIWQGVKDCLPTVFGYLGIGFAAGVVQTAAGMNIFEVVLISMLLYAGSAQFVVASMMVAGAPVFSIVMAIFIVNLRYFLLSASLAPYFKHFSIKQNALNGFLLTDETYGIIANRLTHKTPFQFNWLMGLNVTAYVNWIFANLAGAYFGHWIENPKDLGLDFALSAMFIGLTALQLLFREKWSTDLIVVAVAITVTLITSLFLVSGGLNIVLATLIAATTGVVIDKWK